VISIPLAAGYLARSRWPWLLGAALLLLAAGAGLVLWVEHRGAERGRAEVRAEWEAAKDRQRAVDAAWRADLERQHQEIADATRDRLARVRADAAAADRAAVRLRDVYAAAVARGCPAEPAEGGASAPGTGDLLTYVLGSLEARARALALVADERGAAGSACERAAVR
jgi:hypothetical protein